MRAFRLPGGTHTTETVGDMPKHEHAPVENHVVVRVTIIGDRNATAAIAEMNHWDPVNYRRWAVEATGTSKRMNGDRYSDKVAVALSVGRALENLGRKMQTDGGILVQLESETHVAERLLAGTRRRIRHQRSTGPHPGLKPLEAILAEHGQDAANKAARRRGLPEIAPQPPQEGRDNGLPTVDGKDSP